MHFNIAKLDDLKIWMIWKSPGRGGLLTACSEYHACSGLTAPCEHHTMSFDVASWEITPGRRDFLTAGSAPGSALNLLAASFKSRKRSSASCGGAPSGWFRCFLRDGQACKVWSLDGGGGLATAGLSG